jgi:hypothetical protein
MARGGALDEQAPLVEHLHPAVDVLDADGLGVLDSRWRRAPFVTKDA